MPFVADFEDSDPLAGWDVSDSWQVANEGGQNLLIGQGTLQEPALLLGREQPEWLQPSASDFVVSFDFNLAPGSGGARLVFRYEDGVGYNVLELFPGLSILRRSGSPPNVLQRDTEQVLRQNTNTSIRAETWHNATVWVEGNRLFVYIDRELVLSTEDLNTPQLGAGQIFLQTNNAFRPVRFDNIIVQRAEPYSDHFQGSGIPSTWTTSSSTNTDVAVENDGNQYVSMEDGAALQPVMPPTQDFTLRCRMWSTQGGYNLYLRDGDGGTLELAFNGGSLTLTYFDGSGSVVWQESVNNVYARNIWQDLSVTLEGDSLEIYMDGEQHFDDTLSTTPASGSIRIATSGSDIMRLDDCLVTQAVSAVNESAAFAYAVQERVATQPFRRLRSDFAEDFSDVFRTRGWWEGGRDASGTFTENPDSADHQNFLRMVHDGGPVYRIFKSSVGVEVFGEGTDTRNYNDSTDLVTRVQLRFPNDAPGEAWMVMRARPTITGNYVTGYFLRVRRNPDGTTTFIVNYEGSGQQSVFFEGPIPGAEDQPLPEWIPLTIVADEDRIAFFANDRYLMALDNTEELGGTVALGIEEGTTADFDTLVIRDASPHDE